MVEYCRWRAIAGFLLLLFVCGPGVGTAGASPPISTYGQLPGFEMAAISSSGDHVAILGRIDTKHKRQVLVLDRERKLVRALAVDDIKVRTLEWAGDDLLLVQHSKTAALGIDFTADKAELYGMMVVPINTGNPWSVFGKESRITGGIRGYHGLSNREGHWYGYFGGITLDHMSMGTDKMLTSTSPVLYEVDLDTHKARKIADRVDDQQNYRNWLVGADGKVGVTLDYVSSSGRWTIRDDGNGKIASGTSLLGNVDLVSFGITPGTVIYYEEDAESGEERWFELPLSGGAPKEILSDVGISSRIADNRSRRLIGYELKGDRPSYRFFDAYKQKAVLAAQKAFPGLSVRLVDWNDAFNRLIVQTEGVGDPGSWWLVDIKTGKADILGTSYPMKPDDVGPMKMIHYKTGDGTEIPAVLTLPPGREPKNLPVVVLPHGGPTSRDYPGFDWWAQAFASRGYVVLQPNFRGSSGYGVDFERAGYGQWGRKMQTDISDGLAYLAKEGIVDPARACIVGGSYGGYAALAGVTLQQGLYRCAVAVAGISDVAKMTRTEMSESGRNPVVRRSLSQEVGKGSDLTKISPIQFADRADAPILLIHGKDDTVVLYDQSNDMAAALRRAGKPVELVTLAGEDHWLSKSETRLAMLESAIAFIEKHNPPDRSLNQ